MKTEGIITVITTKVKTFLHEYGDSLGLPLTSENAENGAEQVYRSLLYFQRSYRYLKERREALSREMIFFKNNRDRMSYKRYRANGWPIGSGVMEAAWKSIVKCRLPSEVDDSDDEQPDGNEHIHLKERDVDVGEIKGCVFFRPR